MNTRLSNALPAALVALLVGASPANAVDLTGSTPPDGLRGLLEVPSLFGTGPCAQRTGARYVLHSGPGTSFPAIATIEAQPLPAGQHACSNDALAPQVRKTGDVWASAAPLREFAPRQSGLIVTEQRGSWYRILLGNGDAWMEQPPLARLHDYGSMVLLSQPVVLPAWDGRVCARPAVDTCRTVSLPSRTLRINRSQPVGDELWFQVEFGMNACEGPATADRHVVSGWIPGYGRQGLLGKRALTVWWRPRGC